MKDLDFLIDWVSFGKYWDWRTFLEIIFRITKICNQNCAFCFVDGKNEIYSFDIIINKFEEIIKTYWDIDDLVIQFSGWEPLIHPKFWDLVDHFLTKAKKIHVQTNAVFFSLPQNVEKLKKIEIQKINFFVSFHSHKKEIYEKITNTQNQYERALAGIKNLLQNQNNIKINTVINSYNIDFLDEYLKFFQEEFGSINPNAQLNISIMSEINENKKYLHIKYTNLVKNINKNMNFIQKNNISVSNLYGTGSMCDLPFCMTRKILWWEEIGKKNTFRFENKIQELLINRTKFTKCKKCVFYSTCAGILKSYVDLFGEAEFEPIIVTDSEQK